MHTVKRASQSGFTLLEVLIAMLIMSIGLLGVAHLQVTSMRYNRDTFYYIQAISLAEDMAQRMAANDGATELTAYVGNTTSSAGYATTTCYSTTAPLAGCTLQEMVDYDVATWRRDIEATLPNGTGAISGTGPDYNLAITWTETDGTTTRSYDLTAYP